MIDLNKPIKRGERFLLVLMGGETKLYEERTIYQRPDPCELRQKDRVDELGEMVCIEAMVNFGIDEQARGHFEIKFSSFGPDQHTRELKSFTYRDYLEELKQKYGAIWNRLAVSLRFPGKLEIALYRLAGEQRRTLVAAWQHSEVYVPPKTSEVLEVASLQAVA